MSSSTEKDTIIGRAVARTRDQYRDTKLASGAISVREYHLILGALHTVKSQYRRLANVTVDLGEMLDAFYEGVYAEDDRK